MNMNSKKEQFSVAYVLAVAAVAGYAWYKPSVDDDSVDLGLAKKGGGTSVRSPRLELQLKCSAQPILAEPTFAFSLKKKNYDELRDDRFLVPRVLVVVVVPDAATDWLTQNETELAMRRCGYWFSLRGMPDRANMVSVTLQMQRMQSFSVESLSAIMERIGQGGLP